MIFGRIPDILFYIQPDNIYILYGYMYIYRVKCYIGVRLVVWQKRRHFYTVIIPYYVDWNDIYGFRHWSFCFRIKMYTLLLYIMSRNKNILNILINLRCYQTKTDTFSIDYFFSFIINNELIPPYLSAYMHQCWLTIYFPIFPPYKLSWTWIFRRKIELFTGIGLRVTAGWSNKYSIEMIVACLQKDESFPDFNMSF